MIGILIVSHGAFGESLIHSASHVLGKRPLYLRQLGVTVHDEPETTLPVAEDLIRFLDQGAGVLVLTDIYGATPSNIAARLLRASGNPVSVIMLTAKGDDVDRILGLEMGADDYLAKPFNPRELVARIHEVLRRQAPPEAPGAPTQEERLVRFGPFSLNLGNRTLARDGEPVALTTGEFALLKALALHPREPMSRDKLMELARGREHESYDRSIDVQVSRLRKLLGEDPQSPRYIQTVWGFGYVFIPDGAAQK